MIIHPPPSPFLVLLLTITIIVEMPQIGTENHDDLIFYSGGLFLDDNAIPSSIYTTFSGKLASFGRGKWQTRKCDGFLCLSLSANRKDGVVSIETDSAPLASNSRDNTQLRLRGRGAVNTTKHLWAGAVAAMVSRTFVAPLERLKLEYIVRGEKKKLYDLIKSIAMTQGWRGFWKGNLVNILRTAPFKAINFCAYDTYRKQLLKLSGNEETTNSERFLAGAAAGITATILCLPLDTVSGRKRRENMKQRAEDLNALDQLELGPIRTLLHGAIAGACTEGVTYPFEVVRRQLQLQGRASRLSTLGTFLKVIERGGIPALYAGLFPSLLQVLPSASISYFVYEFMKVVLKVE